MPVIKYNHLKHRDQVIKMFSGYGRGIFSNSELNQLINESNEDSNNVSIFKYIYVENDNPLGYIEIRKAEDSKITWVIYWVATLVSDQRKGIGSELILFSFEKIKELNGENVIVETCSCDEGLSARNFYTKMGFTQKAILEKYYKQGHSKVIFYKNIIPDSIQL